MKSKKIISVILSVLMLISVLPVVSFAADSITIDGPATLISAPEGKYSSLPYVATFTPDSGTAVTSADSPSSFVWEVKKGDAIATDVFFEDGNLIIAGGANGSYTLYATYNGTVGLLPITIKAAIVTNYGTITSDTECYPSTDIDKSKGSKTIEFSFSIPEVPSGKSNIIFERGSIGYGGFLCVPISGNSEQYYISYSKVGGTYLRYETAPGSAGNILFNYGETYNFKLVCNNLTETSQEVYLNNQKIGMYYNSVITTSFTTDHTQRKTLYPAASPDFSRFVEYSGVETEYTPPAPPEPTVTNNSAKKIFIPFDGKTVQTKCSATVENASGNVTWSLPTPYAGVTIDENTGILTVRDNATPGTVTVRASLGSIYDDAVVTLNKIEDAVNASSSWYAGTPTQDGDNYYMAPPLRYRIPELMYNNTDSDFNIVFEADIRLSSAEDFPALFMTTSNGSYYDFETAKVGSADWVNLKVVVNPADGKFRAYINNAPIKLYATGYSNADELTMTSGDSTYPIAMRDIGSSNCQFDNLKIYNISNNPAVVNSFNMPWYSAVDGTVEITDVTSTNLDMNDVTYEYKWFTCDRNGENEAEIKGQTASSLDLSALNLGECFIKAKVRANHQSILNGDSAVIEGSWKESDVCIVGDLIVGGPVLSVNGVKGDAKNIVITEDNSTVELTATLLHTDGTPKNILLALALYDSDGSGKSLVNISAGEFATEANWTSDKTVTLTGLKKGSIVRAFVWYADTLKPIKY